VAEEELEVLVAAEAGAVVLLPLDVAEGEAEVLVALVEAEDQGVVLPW